MSRPQERYAPLDEAKAIQVAVALVMADPVKRASMRVSPDAAVKALDALIQAAQKIRERILNRQRAAEAEKARIQDAIERAEARKHRLSPEGRARAKEQETASKIACAERKAGWAKARADKAAAKESERARVAKIYEEGSRAIECIRLAVTVYESVRIAGRAVGDIWHHELHQLRCDGLFEASLCDRLLKHAQPAAPVRMRDYVAPEVLVEMVRGAREVAQAPAPSVQLSLMEAAE